MAVILTEEDIRAAESYLPIEKKHSLATWMTTFCVERHEHRRADSPIPLPPVWKENRMTRQMFLMGVLAHLYLKKPCTWQRVEFEARDGKTEQDLALLMEVEQYNEWAGSHVVNHLERLKKNKAVADKVYDLLADYKLFENMLLGAIRDEVSVRNNSGDRLAMTLALQNSDEALREAKAALEEAQKGRDT